MDQHEFQQLKQAPKAQPVLRVTDLKNQEPRSLMHGHTLQGNSFHVYLDEDGQLHVLTYKLARFPETVAPTELKYMVVQYTRGLDGGVSSNQDFVPSSQAYPETCDYEFCEALKLRGIDVRFRPYSQPYRASEKEQVPRWAAERFDPTRSAPGVEVCGNLFRHEGTLKHRPIELTVGLVQAAVKFLSVPYAPAKQYYENRVFDKERDLAIIYVREQDAAAVEAKALEFYAERYTSVSDEALAEELVGQVFSFGEHEELEVTHLAGGEVRVVVGHKPNGMRLSKKPLVHYQGPKFGYCEKAASGVYQGRPFLVTFHETVTNIWFSQFGVKEGFVEQYLAQYDLKPVSDSN